MYKYETHLHTYPVSKCAKASVRENLEYYKELGYDGVFITNHFLDGNINVDKDLSYEEKLAFYMSDYEEGKRLSAEIGISVFFGVEMSYKGTDFLVYGLDGEWYKNHPEIMDMKRSEELAYLTEHGAFVAQAHPFRLDTWIDHVRLFPHKIHGCEVINACRNDFENQMAKLYADQYGLYQIAGSDNHKGAQLKSLAGIESPQRITSEKHFIELVKNGNTKIFTYSE